MNLSELMNACTLEGSILVCVWDESRNELSFNKLLEDFAPSDAWAYSWQVKCIYPVEILSGPAVAVEIEKGD